MADPGTSRDGRSGNTTGESGGVAHHVRHLVLPHGPCSPKAHAGSYEKYVVNPLAGTLRHSPPSSRIEPRPAPRRSSSRGGEAEDAVQHRRSLPTAGNARSAPRDGTMVPGVHRTGETTMETTDGDDGWGRRTRQAGRGTNRATPSARRLPEPEPGGSGALPLRRPSGVLPVPMDATMPVLPEGAIALATLWAAEWRKARPSWNEGAVLLAGRPGRQAGPACGRTQAGLRHAASWTGPRLAERRAQ